MRHLSKRWKAALFAAIAIHLLIVVGLFEEALTRIPNTGDEHAILFQAKIFSHFHVVASPPPLPDFFICHYVHVWNGNWFGICPPVASLIRVVGEWLRS